MTRAVIPLITNGLDSMMGINMHDISRRYKYDYDIHSIMASMALGMLDI